jgi:hypothetical protein
MNHIRQNQASHGMKNGNQNQATRGSQHNDRRAATRRVNHALGGLCLIVALAFLLTTGCVRRTLTITTEPPQALVYLNDEEIGRSDVSTDFTWYGDYDVVIRKEGYKTLTTHHEVEAPWYQYVPIDFFVEVLWPWWIEDHHHAHFVLEPAEVAATEEERAAQRTDLIERARDVREQALTRQGPAEEEEAD